MMIALQKKIVAKKYFDLLSDLISIPSFSREEHKTADRLELFFREHGMKSERIENNIIVRNRFFDPLKPSVLLNSHHDTVKPVAGWNTDPFTPANENGKLTGLGSNDAGASLMALIAAMEYFYDAENLPFNIILAATAEEEISGEKGIASIFGELGNIDFAIVGEPTQMKMAVAEKGLLVIDVIVRGKSGHAARNEGINAIYEALPVIEWFRSFRFEKISPWLGEIKMTVTQISSGTQHNVIPDECRLTVDIRVTEEYTHEEILETIRKNISAEIIPRSLRLRSSGTPANHALIKAAKELNIECFGSPTLSDQALISAPSVKIGPGDSARSHTANEYIFLHEIEEGIRIYIELLQHILS